MEGQERSIANIEEHDFKEAIAALKKYDPKVSDALALQAVKSSEGLFNLKKHKVDGKEYNENLGKIQATFDDIYALCNNYKTEFGQIYVALSSLDKEYISGILGSIRMVEAVNNKEREDRRNIQKTVDVLKKYKEDIEKLNHLFEVDKTWELVSNQKRITDSLVAYRDKLADLVHLMDADDVWQDVDALKDKYVEIDRAISGMSNLIHGINSTIEKIQNDIFNQQKEQLSFMKKYEEEFSDYRASVEQKLLDQSSAIETSAANLKKEFDVSQAELSQRFDALAGQQEERILNAKKEQAEVLQSFSQEQESAISAMNAKQDEAMASMAETLEKEKVSLQETVVNINQKLRIAQIIAGSAAALAVIQFVLNIVGVI